MFSVRRVVYMYIAQQCVQVAAVKRMGEIDFINKTGLFQLFIVLYLEDLNPIKLGFSDKYSHHSLHFLLSSSHPSFVHLSIHPWLFSSTRNRTIQTKGNSVLFLITYLRYCLLFKLSLKLHYLSVIYVYMYDMKFKIINVYSLLIFSQLKSLISH